MLVIRYPLPEEEERLKLTYTPRSWQVRLLLSHVKLITNDMNFRSLAATHQGLCRFEGIAE
jgi:hypothetical protein